MQCLPDTMMWCCKAKRRNETVDFAAYVKNSCLCLVPELGDRDSFSDVVFWHFQPHEPDLMWVPFYWNASLELLSLKFSIPSQNKMGN